MVSSKPTPGVNDLQSQFPEIAKEWHPSKNGNLKPSEVTKGSRSKVWWQCSKHHDHEWDALIKSRTIKAAGCPICSGVRVLEGFNDLQSAEPELAKEWHRTRNGNLKPNEVTRGSNTKVWWQCSKCFDHEWESKVNDRNNGNGCPICAGKKVLEGFNDLQSTQPELAKEWHPSKNGDLKPTELTRSSGRKVWWQCSKCPDHIWESRVNDRNNGNGCPICAGQKLLKGVNDLQSTEPELAKEWHPSKNGNLKPNEFTRGSNMKVWWQCSRYSDHTWDASIKHRSVSSSDCPICAGQTLLKGFNDLQSTQPELAKEWHPSKNGDLKPTELTRSSGRKVWWQCSKCPDHIWESRVNDRNNAKGCPFCAEYGFNPGKNAWFYLMQRPGEQQIGITNDLITRMRSHKRNGWTLIEHTASIPGQEILDAETAFKRWLKQEIGLMEGTTENWSTTKMEVQSLAELKARSGIETDLF